jgi:hypothetical protein
MVTDQDFQQLRDRVIKLEEELALLRKQATNADWEAKIIEQINKGDIQAAVDIFQEFHYGASMSTAMRHVMEIKKKIGK